MAFSILVRVVTRKWGVAVLCTVQCIWSLTLYEQMTMLRAEEMVRRRWLSLMTMEPHSGVNFILPYTTICNRYSQLYMTTFSTISLYLTKLYVTQSFSIAPSVTFSEIHHNFSTSLISVSVSIRMILLIPQHNKFIKIKILIFFFPIKFCLFQDFWFLSF